jgi:hypothetical protein
MLGVKIHDYLIYTYTTQIKIGLLIVMLQVLLYISEVPQTLHPKSINL